MSVTETAPPVRDIHPIASIVVGERGNRDLGDGKAMEALMASIVRHDLVHPLILTPDRHLVLGARRLEACRQLGWTDVPAMTVTWIWQALDYLETEHRDPRCLQPLTVHEAMGMDFALRELQWWPKEFPPPGQSATGRAVGRERLQRISGLLGMTTHNYPQARELWQAARGYRETFATRTPVPPEAQAHAGALIAGVTSRRGIGKAYALYMGRPARVRGQRAVRHYEPPAAAVRSTRGDGRRSPQRAQATQIQQGLSSVSGTLAALMHIRDIDPAIDPDQLGDWAADVTGMIRDLSTFRRRLQKGSK